MLDAEPLDLLVIDRQEHKVADRRAEERIYVSLPGRYTLVGCGNAHGGSAQFSCRAVNISVHGIAVAAPVTGREGAAVLANIEQLGRLKGSIVRVFKLGFAMTIEASDQEREVLATKIDWIKRNRDFEILDNRLHARFVPQHPFSLLTLADGSAVSCFVIDISVGGAAVSADIAPGVGTVLAVGGVVGRVVRLFAGGFAVQFIELQDRKEVEGLVTRR
jgi:hypothetical protein